MRPINNSAVGLYPLMVADRDSQQLRLGRSKRLAMLVASTRALVRFHHHRLTLSFAGGNRESVLTPLLFVGNNDYQIVGAGAGKRESLVDGKLDVVVLPGVEEQAERAARVLDEAGADVLLDDRELRAGEKFADADLIGCPLRVTIGKKTLEDGAVDLRDRARGDESRIASLELAKRVVAR